WDSSALCAALLLVTAWEANDDLSLPSRPPLGPPRPVRHAFPDIRRFLTELDRRKPNDPLAEAEASLLRRIDARRPDHAASVRPLLAVGRPPAPIARVHPPFDTARDGPFDCAQDRPAASSTRRRPRSGSVPRASIFCRGSPQGVWAGRRPRWGLSA